MLVYSKQQLNSFERIINKKTSKTTSLSLEDVSYYKYCYDKFSIQIIIEPILGIDIISAYGEIT